MHEENWLCDYAFTVDQFLSPQECDKYIQISESFGYEEATVSSPTGQIRQTNLRNNDRVMFRDQHIADRLWDRARDIVPHEHDGRQALGVNEMLRFLRYHPGQQFDWHQDLPFERDNGEQSFWTFMIYLNDGYQGGETSFEDSYSDEPFDPFTLTPTKGMALFFEHQTHHKGEPVTEGQKYILRTDIMYAPEEADDIDYADDEEWD